MNKPLIDKTDHHTTSVDGGPTAEAVFLVAGNPDLFLTVDVEEQALGSYLDHAITRDPLDLRAHTQRIYLYLADNDREGVYAALLDLFISLGDKGQSLRKHLLRRCKRILDLAQYRLFEAHMVSGLYSITPIPYTGRSLLHGGLESALPLISKVMDTPRSEHSDPLTEALEYLEYGQLEQAMHTLEEALIDNPAESSLMQGLLELYSHGELLDRYHTQTKAMQKAGGKLPDSWLAAEQRIGS